MSTKPPPYRSRKAYIDALASASTDSDKLAVKARGWSPRIVPGAFGGPSRAKAHRRIVGSPFAES